MKLKIIGILAVFSFYWLATIFFTLPENYLQIKSFGQKEIFHSLFYQQWSFFAPPPQTNDRLYYQFLNEANDTLLVEVLVPLQTLRQRKFLANNEETIIDNVLSNSITSISDAILDRFNVYQFNSCKDKSPDKCYEDFLKDFEEEMYSSGSLKTLRNYGVITNSKMRDRKHNKFKIIYTRVPIPKFADRENENVELEEEFVFETKYFDLNKKAWIN
ncbi:MAG: hypothetical protein AB3N16_07300 [Flavobacteriaceae bacterium]